MRVGPKLWLLSSALLAAVVLSATAGGAPWESLLTLSRVEADPNETYRLTKENGPWMLLACSFSGEKARQEAHALVLELRKRYKLAAYLYEKEFDCDEEEAYGLGVDKYGEPLKMQYRRGNEFTEVAVLVGNYQAVDDPEAQSTLQRLKYYQPDCLEIDKGKSTSRSLAGLRLIQQTVLAPGNEKKHKGPMGHAFITTNPLLPKDYFAPRGLDKFVVALNENVSHSLLGCPGKYTVQVAHFTGRVVIDQSDIAAIENGRPLKSRLVEAGEKAEKLAEALRLKGYEAYVFHDRYASIVTIGSFESVGTPRADGKIEINPKIHAVMKTFGAEQAAAPGLPGGAIKQREIVGIPLDIQPIPVEVPKRSIASDYSRDVVGMRWGGR